MFFLLLLVHLFSASRAQSSSSNITIGSTLYTNSSAPSFWPSPFGHFAFGFYPSGNRFTVGTWLVGTPTNTIIWSALRKVPEISSGATLNFSMDGKLLLHRAIGEVQAIIENNPKASYASLLDSGKFALYDSNSELVWNSFDHPTDTLLVGQKLVQDSSLYSSVSATDQSIGKFKLSMQTDGNLNAFPVESIPEGKYVYWSTDIRGAGGNVSLNLAQDDRLFLQNASTGSDVKEFN